MLNWLLRPNLRSIPMSAGFLIGDKGNHAVKGLKKASTTVYAI